MPKRWTEEEIKILKRHYRKRGANYVAQFVEHSPDTIMFKAAQLGIRTNKFRAWEKWEDNYLKRHHTDRSYESIAKTLKRSKKSVTHRASALGLTTKRSENWTEEDLQKLKELYPNRRNSLEKIAALLNRTKVSIMIKARRMKFKRDEHIHWWSMRERNYLLKNIGQKTNREIAEHLGIETYKVDHYIQRQKLSRYKKKPEWTEDEREFLRNNYKKIPIGEIAHKLNRTIDSIKNTASRMGVCSARSKPWTDEDEVFLRTKYPKMQVKDIALALGRSKESVSGKISRIGLSKRKKFAGKRNRKERS
jgi:hypothetical protein